VLVEQEEINREKKIKEQVNIFCMEFFLQQVILPTMKQKRNQPHLCSVRKPIVYNFYQICILQF